MSAVSTPQNIILNITPLFDKKSSFISYESEERAFGFMPTIIVKVRATEDITKLGEVQNLSLITSNGYNMKIKCYVYSIDYISAVCTIKMMPVTPEFMRTVRTSTYKGGEDTVKSLWDQKIDKDVVSDILNNTPLYQKSETNYQFLTRILQSYKFNTIFAYTLDGLIIRDLSSYKFLEQQNRKGTTKPLTTQEISDPKRFKSNVEILARYTNHIKIRVYDKIFDVNKEYESLIANRVYFERFASAKSNYSFKSKELFQANLCEGIQYDSKETDVQNTFIYGRKVTINGTEATVDYTLRSINP